MAFIQATNTWNDYNIEEYIASNNDYEFIVGNMEDGAIYALFGDARLGRADAYVERKFDNKRLFAYLIEE